MSKTARDHAAEMGAERGKGAASWVFDGNTSDETYRRFLELNEAGDPELYDTFGPATGWLSGEFADTPGPADVGRMVGLGGDGFDDSDEATAELEEACDAYEAAADEAYWAELERVARLQVGE